MALKLIDLFDSEFYLTENPEVKEAIASGKIKDAFKHFEKFGQFEGRNPSPLFDTEYYLTANPEVQEAIAAGKLKSAIQHFFKFGQFEKRDPSVLFNTQFYLDTNPGVADAVANGPFKSAIQHYVEYGRAEGRLGAPASKLTFSAAEFSSLEDGTPIAAVTVTREESSIGEAIATITASNGTATAEDYENKSVEVKFAAGETEKTVAIPIVDDTLVEGNETINLTLGNPKGNGSIGEQNTAVLQVLDNDGSTVLSSTPGEILSEDTVDVFLPPGGELSLDITITVPADGSAPQVVDVSPSARRLKRSLPLAAEPASTAPVAIAAELPKPLPLDVFLLQDLSISFNDDVDTLQQLVPNLASELQKRPDTKFGVGSFIDKPIEPFGSSIDYVYQLEQPLDANPETWTSTVNSLTIRAGADLPEAQLEALLQLARRTVGSNEAGFRENARRVVVVSTDDTYHKQGDGADVGITIPNDGDTVVDSGEDYPSVQQVRAALIEADIVPVFAVTDTNIGTYQDLVNQLGFGNVVPLESDSSNLVGAITEGLGAIGSEINIFAVDDNFNYIKEITPAKFDGVLAGQKLTFTVKLKSDGTGGDDTLTLRALGYGDTKVNIVSSEPGSTIDTASILGELKGARILSGFVNNTDTIDYYKFTVKNRSSFNLLLNSPIPIDDPSAVVLAVLRDSKGNVIQEDIKAGISSTNNRFLSRSLEAGDYYLEIKSNTKAVSPTTLNYDLNASAIPLTDSDSRSQISLELPTKISSFVKNEGEYRPVNIRNPDGSTTQTIDPNAETWVVIHGWNGNPKSESPIGELANTIAAEGRQVLVLDWSEPATSSLVNPPGIPFVDPYRPLIGSGRATKWIHKVADFAVHTLRDVWGINPSKINLVGHSLGTYVASEIGFILSNNEPEKALDSKYRDNPNIAPEKQVNTLIALDPAQHASDIRNGYDLDGDTSGDQNPIKFNLVSKFSRAFWGNAITGDGLGSDFYAHSAKESIKVDFNKFDLDANHGNIVYLFRNQVKGEGEIVNRLNLDARQNGDWRVVENGDEGDVVVSTPGQNLNGNNDRDSAPTELVVKNSQTSGEKDLIVYGTPEKDNLSSGSGNDSIQGYTGNDSLYGDSGNDTIKGGKDNDTLDGRFGNDNILGEKGNDSVSGYDGNDYLDGGEGNDTLIGIPQDFNPIRFELRGLREIDTLIGGEGSDLFIIGDNKSHFYDAGDGLQSGSGDYALIVGFGTFGGQDFIELNGSKDKYVLASSPSGLPAGTGIYFDTNQNKQFDNTDELIAIVQTQAGPPPFTLNLDANYVKYV